MKNITYTRTGDEGKTSLIGGLRVAKYDDRVEAYGTVDELSAFIGVLYDQEGVTAEMLIPMSDFTQEKMPALAALIKQYKPELMMWPFWSMKSMS